MKHKLVGFLLLFSFVSVDALASECVYQSKTVSRNNIQIAESGEIVRDIINTSHGNRKCMVNFSVRIGQGWHMASGEWEWSGDQPHQQACAKAVELAKKDVIDRVANQRITNEQVLICNDDERYQQLTNITTGTVGSIEQFRPHPEYDKKFYHNGAECKWFVDAAFTGTDIQKYEGVICETRPNQWVVIDKF